MDRNSPYILCEDWVSGQRAEHKFLSAFQWELQDIEISLSTSKIKKLLITGDCWITARSRKIHELYSRYVSEGMKPKAVLACIVTELKISKVSVSVNSITFDRTKRSISYLNNHFAGNFTQ